MHLDANEHARNEMQIKVEYKVTRFLQAPAFSFFASFEQANDFLISHLGCIHYIHKCTHIVSKIYLQIFYSFLRMETQLI